MHSPQIAPRCATLQKIDDTKRDLLNLHTYTLHTLHVRWRIALHLQQTVAGVLHRRTVEVACVVHVRGAAAAQADDRRLVGVNAQIVAERAGESAQTGGGGDGTECQV